MRMLTIHRPANAEPNDFCWGIEGELAVPMTPCARSTHPDCGCDRAHIGLNSRKGSTTVMVRDVDLTFDDISTACASHYETGWGATPHDAVDLAAAVIGEAADVCTYHRVGTVLRPWYDHSAEEWRYRIASGAA